MHQDFNILLADGQLLIFVTDAVSPFITYLWFKSFSSYQCYLLVWFLLCVVCCLAVGRGRVMKVLFCKQAQVNESGEKLKNNITNSECADGLSKGDFVKGLQNNSNDSYQFRLI